jgi:hypothetical protein
MNNPLFTKLISIAADNASQLKDVDIIAVVEHAIKTKPNKAFLFVRWLAKERSDLRTDIDDAVLFLSPFYEDADGKLGIDFKFWLRRHKQNSAQSKAIHKALDQFHGQPEGALLKNHTSVNDLWAFVLADASSPGQYRVSFLAPNGFFSHDTYDTAMKAFEAAVKAGYKDISTRSLDDIASTPEWAKGMQYAYLLQAGENPFEFDWDQWEKEQHFKAA